MNRPEIDAGVETARITKFVRRVVHGAGAKGVVVGLSGGIDSAVTGELCVRALGRQMVLAILMPSSHTAPRDVRDAKWLAERWGVEAKTVGIGMLAREFSEGASIRGTKLAKANLQARLRMTVLYYYANATGRIVAGTGDRSEIELGYFTKFGDGAADFLPIAHLYKTQVVALAKFLGIPSGITSKPPSPGLWPRHRATDELPAGYDVLDLVLKSAIRDRLSPEAVAKEAGVPVGLVREVVRMNKKSAHKRSLPIFLEPLPRLRDTVAG
ncbi:MAG: NAD+ synthase [Thaumarchaeota archaeon]|nr:NAD+ synthase [Nitrososphaerota archaeon]